MDKADDRKIRIVKDGPYEVHGDVRIDIASIGTDAEGNSVEWIRGREYERGEVPGHGGGGPVHLCRCGHSRVKPFCDGAHNDVEFCGHERAGRRPYIEAADRQVGEAVDLLDDSSLCMGARFCDLGASVWRYAQKSGNAENRELAIEEACKCPSGRLTIVDEEGALLEPELGVAVSAVQDPVNDCRGPLWVQGGVRIEGADGEGYEVRNRVTLCRCGESGNQPYCDGSHYNCEHMEGQDR